MKKFHPIIFILLIFFFYLIVSHFLFPLENLDNPSFEVDNAIAESNTFIHNSSDEINKKQRIIDRNNSIFTENDSDLLVRSHKHTNPASPIPASPPPTSQPFIIIESPVEKQKAIINVQDNVNNNLNFKHSLDNWDVKYFPESIIGPNGIGLMPSISIKNGKDDYGFTFPNNYVQLEFTNFSQYNFSPYNYGDSNNITPFVYLQSYISLNPGKYQLKYNIQTRPNISWDIDSRTIGIMSMVNKSASPIFSFRKLVNKKPKPFLTDETILTPQILNFTISDEEALYPVTFSFIFIVTDPTITNNCTVALGDIQILNCAYNACTNI